MLVTLIMKYKQQIAAALAAVLVCGLAIWGVNKYQAYKTQKREESYAAEIKRQVDIAAAATRRADILQGQLTEAIHLKEQREIEAAKSAGTVSKLRVEVVERPKAVREECQAQLDTLYNTFSLREKDLIKAYDDEHAVRLAGDRALGIAQAEIADLRIANTALQDAVNSQQALTDSLRKRLETAERSAKRWKLGTLTVGAVLVGGGAAVLAL